MINLRFYPIPTSLTLTDLCALLGIDVPPSENAFALIKGIAPLHEAKEGYLTWFHNAKYLEALQHTQAGYCLVEEAFASHVPAHTVALIVAKPYRAWGHIASHLYPERPENEGVSPFAKIHPTARLGNNCHIGAFTVIGPMAEIGDDTFIADHVTVGRGVVIGGGSLIHSHVTLSHTLIGTGVVIKPGARIGQPGFGFHMEEKGHVDVPQLGCVIIGNNVHIGANTCIDRGSQGDTLIGNGVRIDNLVQIAHNVEVGANSVLVAQVGVAGSTKLGKFVIAAGQAGIAGHLTIGDGVKIAAQSGLMKNVNPGETVGGSPAVSVRDWHRQTIALQRLAKGPK